MDWKSVGKQIASTGAQILGEVIPIPGAGIAASAVANALGTNEDPDEISQAIKQDPDAARKLQEAEMEHREALEQIRAQAKQTHESEVTGRQEAVNETMRVGYQEGVLWRRAVGWSFAFVSGLTVIGIMAVAAMAILQGEPELLNQLPDIVAALSTIFYAYIVVLGVAGYQEGKLGRAMAGEKAGGIAEAIKAIKR